MKAVAVLGRIALNAIKLSEPDIMTSGIDSQPNSPEVNNMENFQNLCQHPRKHREFAAFA